MQYLNTVGHLARRGCAALRRCLARVGAIAADWWQSHWDRVAEEYGYADAFIAVVIAAVELVTTKRAWRLLARELAAMYVAVLRALRPRFVGEIPD